MSTRKMTLRDQVLAALDASGLTMFEIARRSGVERAALSRFKSGKGGLTLDSLERLAPIIGIEIVRNPRLVKASETESPDKPKTTTIRVPYRSETTIVTAYGYRKKPETKTTLKGLPGGKATPSAKDEKKR